VATLNGGLGRPWCNLNFFLNNKLVLISAKVKHVFCPNIFYNKGGIHIYKKYFVCLNGFFNVFAMETENRQQKYWLLEYIINIFWI